MKCKRPRRRCGSQAIVCSLTTQSAQRLCWPRPCDVFSYATILINNYEAGVSLLGSAPISCVDIPSQKTLRNRVGLFGLPQQEVVIPSSTNTIHCITSISPARTTASRIRRNPFTSPVLSRKVRPSTSIWLTKDWAWLQSELFDHCHLAGGEIEYFGS
jgi:hypothetical protein